MHDAGVEQEPPDEHVEPFDEDLADTRSAEQQQRHGKVLPRPGEGVEDEQAREALRMRDRPGQPDRSTPILHDDHRVVQIERFEQRLQALHMPPDPVELWIRGLVRAAEAEMVRHDRTVTRRRQWGDEVPVQEAPRRVAVHQNDGPAVTRPFVDVVHSSVGRIEPARLERPQPSEGPVRRHDRRDSRGGTRSTVVAVRPESGASARAARMSSFPEMLNDTDRRAGSESFAVMPTASLLQRLGQLQKSAIRALPGCRRDQLVLLSTGSALPAY